MERIDMNRFNVRQAAVLGAGVMGAQIAAHFINLRIPVLLFDLPSSQGDKSATARQAIERLGKIKPPPLGLAPDGALIRAANYAEHLPLLSQCDLVIEAIAERMELKRALYRQIAPHLAPQAIVASNTSGLSITELAGELPEVVRPQFCGVHFFNPPRYMSLVELIPAPQTRPQVLDDLETFVTSSLGKSCIRAKDTPNFVANRIGVANMLFTLVEAERYGLTFDVVDDLTGKKLGRAPSATCRTADIVGLDTLAHVVSTLETQLGSDPFHPHFATPPVVQKLIGAGSLGAKTGAGFFRKQGRDILRLDPTTFDYVPVKDKAAPEIDALLKLPPSQRLAGLRQSSHPQAQFLWAIHRDILHYCAVHLADVAHSARDMDFALRWGFGWREGPFEIWQQAGWTQVAELIQADIAEGKALSNSPLPSWVFDGRHGVHGAEGSWNASAQRNEPTSNLPVYRRQLFPQSVTGSKRADPASAGTTLFETPDLRAWTLDGEVVIASLKTKMRTFNTGSLQGLSQAVSLAEEGYKALVIWGPGAPFSAGGDLNGFLAIYEREGVDGFRAEQKTFQDAMRQLRYSLIPTVAAVQGYALGGGCEAFLHVDRRVAHFETNVGLVEVGVGLLPGAGGLTTVTRQAGEKALKAGTPHAIASLLKDPFTRIMSASVSGSALEARQMELLREGDVVVAHPDELLAVALSEAKALHEAGYRPPLERPFPVAGRDGKATLMAGLVNMNVAGYLTDYDVVIGEAIADVICGGEVDSGTMLTETAILSLERKHFGRLMENAKTRERVQALLATGKPLRN
jgi:3-hydroxyacyl-CoA dehydrogenase